MLRSVSPAGAPVEPGDIVSGLITAWMNDHPIHCFQEEICRYFGTKHSFLVSSGKAALSVVLRALSRISDRQEVIIPAFSSFCLPSAIAKVGMKITLCDVSLETLDFDLDRLEKIISERTLCVIPVHLFGLSAHMDEINTMAKAKGAYVVEDTAQAAGAQLNGMKLGTIGEIGIFSLGRGKNITTVDGGGIVTQSDSLAAEVRKCMEPLGPRVRRIGTPISSLLKALVLSVFLHSRLYWFPELLPFLKLGAAEFSTGFKIGSFSKFQAGMGISVLRRLDRFNEIRRANASYLMDHLSGMRGLRIPRPIPGSYPVYLRFPLMVGDPAIREAAYQALIRQGLGVSKTYPSALNAIQELKPYAVNAHQSYPNAEMMADSVLTLPTHPYVTQVDLDRIVQVFKSLSGCIVRHGRTKQMMSEVAISLSETLQR